MWAIFDPDVMGNRDLRFETFPCHKPPQMGNRARYTIAFGLEFQRQAREMICLKEGVCVGQRLA